MESRLIIEAIQKYWDSQASDRAPGHIGMSALGHCGRQLAYMHHQIQGNPLDWRAKVIFNDGHMHHDQIRKAIREGLVLNDSCYSLLSEEEEVNIGVLTGHIDGMLWHDDAACASKEHKTMLLEVKSMNDRGFQELKRTNKLSFEYRAQVSGYLRASQVGLAYILVKNKNTGELYHLIYEGEDVFLDSRLDVLGEAINSTYPEEVRREYQADADGKFDWQCNYCPFIRLCWRHEGIVEETGPKKYKLVRQNRADVTKTVTSDLKTTAESEKTIGTELALQEASERETETKFEKWKKRRQGRSGRAT